MWFRLGDVWLLLLLLLILLLYSLLLIDGTKLVEQYTQYSLTQ